MGSKLNIENCFNKKYGNLVALKEAEPIKKINNGVPYSVRMIWCKCDCGREKAIRMDILLKGMVISCGCAHRKMLIKRNTTHGLRKHPLYKAHANMINRCENTKNKEYHNYGERGISVCREWRESFKLFYDWAIANGWQRGLELDRIIVDGNYEPSNCRWATESQQCRNTRLAVRIKYNGEIKSLCDWCDLFGLPYSSIRSRYYKSNKNISPEKLFLPIGQSYRTFI